MIEMEQIRLVLAEDDYLTSEKIREVAETLGYAVIGEASDGEQAIAMTCDLRPDVVLMDIKMPGMNGLVAAEKIQQQCPTPIVVLTAYQSNDLLEQANRAGVGAYLSKPPNPRELHRTVTMAISRFQDMQALRALNIKLEAEIAEHQRAERELRQALREKEVLLKEVHHRVKNNLQMISSLLYFQVQNEEDQRVFDLLQNSRDRIRSIAMVHEQIYQSKALSSIHFEEYIHDMTAYLFHAYGMDARRIELRIDAEPVVLTAETAIPCALILNELVSNICKYAFPEKRPGRIDVRFSERDEAYCFVVADTGAGLPDTWEQERRKSFGLNLVTDLVTKQLHGTLKVVRDPGTTFRMTFPKPV